MRLNKYLAASTQLSRRAADTAVAAGKVTVNGKPAEPGQDIHETDVVALGGLVVRPAVSHTTIMFYKPVGFVVSRQGQGSRTIYELLPPSYHRLNPIGRLDKDSSGLLLLTDNGTLANDLTHPSRQKVKIYEIILDKPLEPLHRQMISDYGLTLEDGVSKLQLDRIKEGSDVAWRVTMHEGRNRQIRRTLEALGYRVTRLHRTHFGPYALGDLPQGSLEVVPRA